MTNGLTPPADERELLLAQLEALRTDLIRGFLRDNDVTGLGERKAQTIARAREVVEAGEVAWEQLIDYLDRVEPRGKQHVYLYKLDADVAREWADTDEAASRIEEAGLTDLWQQRRAVAAPEEMRLSSIRVDDDGLEIFAIGRRTFPRRRTDLDPQAFPGRPEIEALVYQRVSVRAWVRLRVDRRGSATVQISQLPRKADYEGARADFMQLISAWFPSAALAPTDLAKAVSKLHEDAEAGGDEALLQAVEYHSDDGIRSSLSSTHAGQSVLHQTNDLDEAAKRMRGSGPGAGGNFYFLPAAGRPLHNRVHVSIVVRDNRINFRRPTEPGELEYVLGRIRAFAT